MIKSAVTGLKIVGISNMPDENKTRLWLEILTDKLYAFFEDPNGVDGIKAGPKTKRNNHRYWEGLAIGMTATIL